MTLSTDDKSSISQGDQRFMTTLTRNTAIVIIPPEELQHPIDVIRRAHDSKINQWMAHIPLTFPCCPLDDFDAIEGELLEACGKIQPFELELSTFGSFRHRADNFTIWLGPQPEDPLRELYAALQTVLLGDPEKVRPQSFRPHLGLGQVRGKIGMQRLTKSLEEAWSPVRFKVSQLTFIGRPETSKEAMQVVKTIPLGSAVAVK